MTSQSLRTSSSGAAASRRDEPPGRSDVRAADKPDRSKQACHARSGFDAELRARRLAAALARDARAKRDAGTSGETCLGGPLGHQRGLAGAAEQGGAKATTPVPAIDAVADRILAGVDGAGRASARVDVGGLVGGDWAGASVEIVAGARGVEVSVFAQSGAVRRVVETQLADLARALSERGVKVARLRVGRTRSADQGDNQPGARQDGTR